MLDLDPKIASDNFREFYTPLKQKRMVWSRDANRYENFRYNQHYSEPEVADLLKFRQAPMPIGMTTAICDMAEALFTASDPVPRVVPIPYPLESKEHEIAKQVAYRYDRAIRQTWRDSFGGLQFDKIVRDYNNVGLGYHYLVPRHEFGQFSVDYKHIPWHYVYVDNNAKDILFRDADSINISFVMSRAQGLRLARTVNPDITKEEFEQDWCDKDFIDSPTDSYQTRYSSNSYDTKKVVRFIARMQLEQQTVYQIIPKKAGVKVPFKVVRELTAELEKARVRGDIGIVEQKDNFLTEYSSLGSKGWKKVYPVRNYNVIPSIYDHRENPYPHGRVWYIYPLQRALNRFVSLTILNAALSNSLKFFAEANSIVDIEKIQNYGAIPGIFIQWRRTSPDAKPPQAVAPIPLSDAFLQFPKFVIYLMEYVSGINSVMQGDPSESPSVFATVATLQNAGGMKIKRRLRNLEVSLSQMGRVTAEFYREYAPPNGVIMNVKKGEVETTEYNKMQVSDGGDVEIKPETDLSIGFRDVEFTVESSKGFQAATEAQLLGNMAQTMKLPQLIPLVLDRLNIPDADKVVEQIQKAQDTAERTQQLEQALAQTQGQNKELVGKVFQQTVDMVKSQAQGKAGRLLERFRKQFEQAGVDFNAIDGAMSQELEGIGGQQYAGTE